MPLSITYKVEVEFSAGTWTDITSYVESVRIRRGRNREIDRYSAGTATVRVNNADRRFDPEHTTGPYYANLKVRKRIRCGVTYSATTYYRFYGYIDGYPQSYEPPTRAYVDIEATDAFKVLAGAELPSVWEQEVLGYETAGGDPVLLYARLDEQSGTVATDSSTYANHGVYEGGVTFSSRAGLLSYHSGTGLFFDGVDDRILWANPVDDFSSNPLGVWLQMDTIDTADDQVVWEVGGGHVSGGYQLIILGTDRGADTGKVALGDAGSSAVLMSAVRVDDGQPHFIVEMAGANFPWIDGAESNGGSLVTGISPHRYPTNQNIGMSFGGELVAGVTNFATFFKGTLDEIVWFDAATTLATASAFYDHAVEPWNGDSAGTRLGRVLDYVGFSASARDIDTGDATLLPAALGGSALAHMQLVEETEGGRLFIDRNGNVAFIGRRNFWEESAYRTSQATFGDPATGSQLPYSTRSRDVFDFSDQHLVNEVRYTQQGLTSFTIEDTSSQTSYGVASLSRTSAETNRAEIVNQGEWILSQNAQPQTRVNQITLTPERSPSVMYPVVLAADLGYRYTFTRTPSTGSAISKEVHLEEIAEDWTPGSFVVAWGLASGHPKVFMWDTAGHGWDDGVWGY